MQHAEQTMPHSFLAGIDTKLQLAPPLSSNEKMQSLGFLSFLEEVQVELTHTVAWFVEANGYQLDKLIAQGTDLNHLFADQANYAEFLALFTQRKANIEQLIASDLPEYAAHQAIVDDMLALKVFIETRYPNPAPQQAAAAVPPRRSLEFFLGMAILFLPIIFAWFTLRKGYSQRVRWLSFMWLLIFLWATFPSPNKAQQKAPANSAISSESQR